jgi:hypothetical protein
LSGYIAETRTRPKTRKEQLLAKKTIPIPAPAAHRYAHPNFTETASSTAAGNQQSLAEWSKLQLGLLPPVARNGLMDLTEVIGAAGVKEIQDTGEIHFHTMGDTGVGMAEDAEKVADDMTTDYHPDAGGLNPAFLLHLGDVIYGPDKAKYYPDRFYRPYRNYPGKIIAIPGNHDGEVKTSVDDPSLHDFVANFCTAKAAVPPGVAASGIFRETMTEPGVYWMLSAPFVNIIGLYSNRLENPGYLQGITNAKPDLSQIEWLQDTLASMAKAKDGRALIIATHHPPYSQSGHSGSTEMNQTIDDACQKAGVTPDAFFSGHAHNYQRYTRRINQRQVPYIVAGTGGMPPQPVVTATGQPSGSQITYDAAISSYGYVYVTVSPAQLKIEFWPLGSQHSKAADTAIVNLSTHVVT